MRRLFALAPILALAVFAEEGTIPFKLGAQGFEEREARYRLEPLHQGAVSGAAGTPDGKWVVWTSGETLFALGPTGVGQVPIPANSRLLGCTPDGKAVVAEPLEAAPAVCAYDLAGGARSVLFEGQDAAPFLGPRLAGLLCVLCVSAVQEGDGFTFHKLNREPAGKASFGSSDLLLAHFGARAIVVVPAEGAPLLLSPDAAPVPLDPVLTTATGVALSPDRPFVIASTQFDVGFVCHSTPGLRPLPLEGYTPLAWPSRSAILLSRPDGLYLLTLVEEAPPVDPEAARLAEEERKRREEAERARREEEAEQARQEEEKRRLADAERAKLDEEKRRQAEAEAAQAKLETEKRRLAEEERKRQEEVERAKLEAEHDLVDFAGLEKARIGDTADAVKAALAEPDRREEGEVEGTTDWIYAGRGLVLTFDEESKQLVRLQAKAKPDFLPAQLKDRFRAFRGKTGKGIALGASRAEIEAAYGQPANVLTVGAVEVLRYAGDPAKMSFQVERGKLVLIILQRDK